MSLGGSATVVHDIISNWQCQDDQLFLIVFFNLFDKRYDDLYKLKNLKIITLNKRSIIDFKFLKNLKRILQEIKPDIISTHLTCVFYLRLLGQQKRSKIYHTIHAEPCCDLPYLYRFILKRDFQKERIKLIGCCDYISNKANSLYKTKCKTIRNGLNVPILKNVESNGNVRFLFVGRFSQVKNLVSIIDAFKLLPSDLNNYEFKICGFGNKLENKEIENKVKQCNKSANIKLIGKVNDLKDIYSSSDVLILASSREGMPMTVLEALSYGMAFLVTNVGGISEFVKNDFNGMYLDGVTPNDICSGIVKFLTNPNLIIKFRENSKLMTKEISGTKMSKEYMEYMKNE